MKFSIIMASTMAPYRTAANDRENKILRAINSVFSQTFQDFELIVVADGCQKTIDIVSQIEGVRYFMIQKSRLWSGAPRTKGIEEAKGDYIVYLDIDDIWGKNHLQNIANGLKDYDWVWFDDIRWVKKTQEWYENPCDIIHMGRQGTSNICHKRTLSVRWNHTGYAHDHFFIRQLRDFKNFAKIEGGEYYVCHLPGAGGYEV